MTTATLFRSRFKRSRLAGFGAPSPPSGSGHSAATEEPAQSVTLPPTSPHAIVWCADTPVLQSPGDRRGERGKRKPRLGPMSANQPQRPHQSEPRDSQQARGVPGQHDGRSAASTVSHETPQNAATIWPSFSSNFRGRVHLLKKCHLESGLYQREEDPHSQSSSKLRASSSYSFSKLRAGPEACTRAVSDS